MANEIRTANEVVGIEQACVMVGMDYATGFGKHYCPFGNLYHADGGISRSFRVYPNSNSAYCFACSAFYNPVKLMATAKGISDEDAAEFLLESVGYVPPDAYSRFQAAATTDSRVETNDLAEALKLVCARLSSEWETRQFDDDVAQPFAKVLGLLPKVKTDADAEKWLATAKIVMTRALGDQDETE